MGEGARIHPVLLSGGSGTRLWPLSRARRPKQFLALHGDGTMLQQTARRTADPARFAPLTVIGNDQHRFLVAEQLRTAGLQGRVVLEPCARNTAPAAAVAALAALEDGPDALVLLMPADHVILDVPAFLAAVAAGEPAARAGRLVLFGVAPDHAASGYGYIRPGAALDDGAFTVAEFIEKPDVARAEVLLADGCLWNGGIFLLPAQALLDELQRFAPEVLASARAAWDGAARDADFVRLAAQPFAACPSISLDYAVLERTALAAVTPVDCGWTDVGAWSALWEIGARDPDGNVLAGPAYSFDARGCYLRSEGPVVTALDVDDLIVVASPDAVLVTRRDADQGVKRIVERLRAERPELVEASWTPGGRGEGETEEA